MSSFSSDLSSLTIERLKLDLKRFNISVPSAAKKEIYVQLYKDKILSQHPKLEFSSDEEQTPKMMRKKKPGSPRKATTASSAPPVRKDPADMTDEELAGNLRAMGETIGPIIESTRRVYERKLRRLCEEGVHSEGTAMNGRNGENMPETAPIEDDGDFSDSDFEETSLMKVMDRAEEEERETSVRRRATASLRDSPRRRDSPAARDVMRARDSPKPRDPPKPRDSPAPRDVTRMRDSPVRRESPRRHVHNDAAPRVLPSRARQIETVDHNDDSDVQIIEPESEEDEEVKNTAEEMPEVEPTTSGSSKTASASGWWVWWKQLLIFFFVVAFVFAIIQSLEPAKRRAVIGQN